MFALAFVALAAAIPLRPGAEVNAWQAGAASISVLPTVNGTTNYWTELSEFDASSAGTFVQEFDLGRIPIGNGAADGAHWVRNDIRASVFALRGDNGITVIFLGADLYMLFAADLASYYELVREAVGEEVFATLRFSVSASHNHEGPDTSGLGGINPRYYEYMLGQFAAVTLEALGKMEPVTLTVADSVWRFGQGDNRDPRVVDPTLNVLQARSVATGAVVATMVQWAFHPEIIAFFSPTVPDNECVAVGLAAPCNGRGRTLTGDFPYYAKSYIQREVGGEVVYISGALGVQIGPNQNAITPAQVWEVSEDYPITGDGSVAPANATLVPKNFRQALLIGRELAFQALRSLSSARASPVAFGSITYKLEKPYLRLSNLLFRAGLSPGYVLDRPLVLGYNMREMFICTPGVPASDQTCVSDNFETIVIGGYNAPVRKGSFAKSEVGLIEIGDIKMLSIPGELSPELAHGLPTDFDTAAISKYYLRSEYHTLGADYALEGVAKDMMKCKYCWMFGLTHDAGGYILPISDFRISCFGDSGVCDPAGYIAGTTCKEAFDAGVVEGPVFNNCMLGQISQWQSHYEEILSSSWDAAGEWIKIVAQLTGNPPSGRFTKTDWTQ
eukprot:TRINITY_DN482_c0_g2_i1.p1 TRINITY_DN482_c0_g2~~TRINITY_DN482_c0_g2_i1.p1  ORF type:complete len:647 (-),score=142.41 TRINITY_DN482_c0_g2_i1:40-1884(-)